MAAQEPKGPPRILLVDDQAFFLNMYKSALEGRGYRVATAMSAEGALEQLKQTIPDLIVLDVQLPGTDGIETCARIKADERLRHIPVIILTGTDDPKLNQRAFKAGAGVTVLKKAGPERFLNMVKVVLEAQRPQP